MVVNLSGDDAQTFVNLVDEVRLRTLPPPEHRCIYSAITPTLRRLGVG